MKKRNIIYSIVCTLFCFICLSCSDEKGNPLASSTETGLTLQINAGQNTFTRADGITDSSAESAWDNVIRYLDVFIFDSTTGELVPNCYFHFGDGSNNIVDPVCLISGNWKNRFQDHETCDVYVIANLHIHSSGNNTASETDLEQIQTLSDLQQLVDEYKDIYQSVSQDSKMPFTMSGCMGWEPAESSNVYTIPVELTRLAAKIEISLDLKFTTDQTTINGTTYRYPTNDDIGQLQYSVHNYATNARVLPGNDDTFGYTIASAAETSLKFMDTDNSDNSVPKIIAYTYPTEWSNDILKETYVILNAQLKRTTDQGGDPQYMNNYYKIPLRLSTDDNKKLERNHWYKVKATITAKGNATPDEPVEVTNVQYEVAPWYDTNIDINGDTPLYLELSEYDVVMRNVDTYDLTFASSSQIVKDPTDVTSPKAEIEIKEIYYKNKYGKKIDLTNDKDIIDNTYLSVKGGLNGHLVIRSPIPVNKTIRYITLTVKNAQYDESDQGTHSCIKTVTIKQYPLEYITGISGLYSYLDENTGAWPMNRSNDILSYLEYSGDNYVYNGTIQDEIIQGFNVTISGLNGKIGNKVDMKSKFYVKNDNGEGRIFRIDYSYIETYEKVSSPQDFATVYVRKYMLEKDKTDNDVLVPENEGKKYQITAKKQEGGDYINVGDEYIQVQDGTGDYTIERKSNKNGTYIDVYGKTKDTNESNYIYYAYYKDLPLSYYLEDNGTASNNQMYHVVITSTSGDYQLGRPIMSKDTDNKDIVDPKNPDNDKLVSPSFMLASQLGNSSTISWEDAKNQCKNYVEVGINGEVYDDWRLPTAAEINIIIKYQTNSKVNTQDDRAVMDYVLNYEGQSNPDYWVSRSNYFMHIPASGEGTLQGGSSDAEHRVRCVRDFHVGEPTE